jgi:two-component system response regulator YesN
MMGLNRLIKVMLVDDEENTRNLLKLLVNWEELGFTISGEASSGQEALYMLDEIQPDLIITDVRMPYMDGLEFSKLALQAYPNLKIIVLTAYEDFSSAQQSVQMGVSAFLLKPIKRESLTSTLNSIAKKIEEELDMQQEYARIQEQLGQMRETLQNKFLSELLIADIPDDELEQKIQYFSLEPIVKQVQAAVITLRGEPENMDGEKRILYSIAAMDLVKQFFGNDSKFYVFSDHLSNIVIAYTGNSGSFEAAMERLKDILSSKLQGQVSAGIGTLRSGLHGLSKSYQEACMALKYCIIYGDKIVLSYKDVSMVDSDEKEQNKGLDEIEFFVRAGLQKEAVEAIHRSLVQQSLAEIEDINAIRVKGINIITLLFNIAAELHVALPTQEFGKSYMEMINLKDISEIEKRLIQTASELTDATRKIRKKKSSQQIAMVMEYINEHLSDPTLGLASLSAHFYLNSSYLSRTFKHQVGSSIVEYLTDLRIQKAKELLQNSDKMAYEIGAEVGIPDPNYFGKCFKKYAGCSIQEFRKRVKGSSSTD